MQDNNPFKESTIQSNMYNSIKKKFFFILIFIFMCNFVLAIPSIPNSFSGIVKYSDDTGRLLVGYKISASVGGYPLGEVGEIGAGNNYEVILDSQGHSGEVIFYIGEVPATPTSIYQPGEFVNLDLTIGLIPVGNCGNGVKEAGEQCDGSQLGTWTCEKVLGISGATGTLSCTSSCTFNYANCVYVAPSTGGSSNGGSSGGGGGGGGGGGSYTPVTTSSSNTNKTPIVLDNKTSSEETGNNAPITGFSISEFAKSSGGIFSIIGIVTILVIGSAVLISKKKKSKPVENKAEETHTEVKEEKKEEEKD